MRPRSATKQRNRSRSRAQANRITKRSIDSSSNRLHFQVLLIAVYYLGIRKKLFEGKVGMRLIISFSGEFYRGLLWHKAKKSKTMTALLMRDFIVISWCLLLWSPMRIQPKRGQQAQLSLIHLSTELPAAYKRLDCKAFNNVCLASNLNISEESLGERVYR